MNIIGNGEWELSLGVLGFLKLAHAPLNAFPSKDWIFGEPISNSFNSLQPKKGAS